MTVMHQGVCRADAEEIMHPMFVKLFIEPDTDGLLADEEDSRRRGRRARRGRSRMVMRVTPAGRDRRPRR